VYHRVKDKVLYVESGHVELTYGWDADPSSAATLSMTTDMAFHVPQGMYHSLKGLAESKLLELSTHHNEKDVLTANTEPDYDGETDS
jgi:mannose-6-phosphate isomerase-like protein (cupin superfamily)